MKKVLAAFVLIFGMACSLKVLAIPQAPATGQQKPRATAKQKTDAQDGERKFQENCGRCHNPPDSLSRREVKAVVQHMRVRAMLSKEDEELILKFLAP